MGIELSDGLLAIVSHPDDETFGCGGTLALHRANNEDVRVLCLSCNPAERRREFMDATSELRVENRDIWDAEHILENAETIRDDTSVELATSESGLGRRKEGFRGKK